jgi:hypothetical protein
MWHVHCVRGRQRVDWSSGADLPCDIQVQRSILHRRHLSHNKVTSPPYTPLGCVLLQVLVRLGPAFVKIGQALSSRPDVMPPDYLVELELLQDRIPPFPTAAALATLQQELGAPVSAVSCCRHVYTIVDSGWPRLLTLSLPHPPVILQQHGRPCQYVDACTHGTLLLTHPLLLPHSTSTPPLGVQQVWGGACGSCQLRPGVPCHATQWAGGGG